MLVLYSSALAAFELLSWVARADPEAPTARMLANDSAASAGASERERRSADSYATAEEAASRHSEDQLASSSDGNNAAGGDMEAATRLPNWQYLYLGSSQDELTLGSRRSTAA